MMVLSVVVLPGPAWAESDFEVWNQMVFKWRQDHGQTIWLMQDLRSKANVSGLRLSKTNLGATFPLGRDVDLGPFFAVVWQEPIKVEYRPSAQLRVRWEALKTKWHMRQIIEMRIFEHATRWRWRSQLKAEWSPWFVSDEIFVDCRSMEVTQNRFQAGRDWKIGGNTTLSAWYILASERFGAHWIQRHGLGTTITVNF
ncbi:MAG: DUF2490 domain-containing protein [Armatimonadetes bacterium]|nr:DUF2490 domain-containing protein [Armatimonadota bacterium]